MLLNRDLLLVTLMQSSVVAVGAVDGGQGVMAQNAILGSQYRSRSLRVLEE